MLKGPFQGIIGFKFINIFLLSILIVLSCITIIYLQYKGRMLHSKVQSLSLEKESILVEWNKLLLEYGAWTTDSRVEKIAIEQLGMRTITKVKVITP